MPTPVCSCSVADTPRSFQGMAVMTPAPSPESCFILVGVDGVGWGGEWVWWFDEGREGGNTILQGMHIMVVGVRNLAKGFRKAEEGTFDSYTQRDKCISPSPPLPPSSLIRT